MTNKDIIDYVQHTPHNINPVILKQKLKEQDEGIAGAQDAVQYIEQELTEEQKLQVRKNLDLYYVNSKITDIIPEQEVTFWLGKANFTNWIDPYELGIVENPEIIPVTLKIDSMSFKGELSCDADRVIATFNLPITIGGGTAIVDLNNGIIKDTYFDGDEYTIHMYFEYKEVEKIPTECFDLDGATNQIKEELAPVSYIEQDLDLTEQMQARRKLGLYGKYEDYVVLENLGPDTPGYPWQLTADLRQEEEIIVEIWDAQPSKLRYKATLYRHGEQWNIPGLGDLNYQYHWGNQSLIKYDEEASYEQNDTGEPIVLYAYKLGVDGAEEQKDACKLLIDPNFLPEYWIGFKVIIKRNYTSTITNIVPKEYLPKAAAIPDVSGDTVTAEQFNMLLQALREAGYLNL